jgi:type 1 fimbria pilin
MKSPNNLVLTLLLVGATLLTPRAEAALDCQFGAVPFDFGSAEPNDASLDSETLVQTPMFGVIPGLNSFEPEIELGVDDITCERTSSGSIALQITNLGLPPAVGTASFNGRNYDIYATSEAWAGYIIVRRNGDFQNGSSVLLSKLAGTNTPRVDLSLRVKYVKLADPLTGTVGELASSINVPQVRFDLVLPDNRAFSQLAAFYGLSVDILGVVCNLLAPHLLDFGQIPIADLRVPGTVVAQQLQLQMNCGSGFEMVTERVPLSMQVTFTGGVATGLLDTTQANVKFGIVDRLGRGIPFGVSTAVATLTNNGQLTASNTVRLSVRPQLQNLAGDVQAGAVSGNLGIQVIYK